MFPPPVSAGLPIPTIEIIFSEEFLKTRGLQEQLDCLVRHCRISSEDIVKISHLTVGQRDNPAWHLARKGRLTASNFGVVLKAKRVTPSQGKERKTLGSGSIPLEFLVPLQMALLMIKLFLKPSALTLSVT